MTSFSNQTRGATTRPILLGDTLDQDIEPRSGILLPGRRAAPRIYPIIAAAQVANRSTEAGR